MQESIKIGLFEIIYLESDMTMKKHLADTIGEIAGSLIGANNEAWPDFKINVWKFFKDSNINSFFAGFYILESFLTFAPDHFKDNTNDLYSLFKSGLEHENHKLKLSALKCFVSYLEVLEIKQHSSFQSLIISIFEAVYSLIQNNNDEEGLEALSEMLETEHRFFKKNFKELVELLTRVFRMPNIEGGVRRMAT